MKEVWKRILEYDDYAVSNQGRVVSHKSGRWEYLNPANNSGHYMVSLHGDKFESRKIGDLVLTTFTESRPKGKELSHLNGSALDDRLENLKWETKKENEHRKIEHGTKAQGEKHGNAKLTERDIKQIRKLLKQSYLQGYIAGMFNISQSVVSRIKCGSAWNHMIVN